MSSNFEQSAQRTIRLEGEAVAALGNRINASFTRACELILACKGRVVVTGMGKSGHVANKIAATLASTGTPAFALHPGEASHGDLGMIVGTDIVISISGSGSTEEIVSLLPQIKRIGCTLVAITGNPDSTLATEADVHLDASVDSEACPLGLAPTSSTTAALVMGDALAVALLEARGFGAEDFAFSHPGGTLGKKLLLMVDDIMKSGNKMPCVKLGTLVPDALLEITHKGLGMTLVTDSDGKLCGVFTDGDLRRTLDSAQDIRTLSIDDVMTRSFKSVQGKTLAAAALKTMEDTKISALAVVDGEHHPLGVVHLHDLIQAGLA